MLLFVILCSFVVFQEEYRVEGISLERITFTDNRPVLDMFLQVYLAIFDFLLFNVDFSNQCRFDQSGSYPKRF